MMGKNVASRCCVVFSLAVSFSGCSEKQSAGELGNVEPNKKLAGETVSAVPESLKDWRHTISKDDPSTIHGELPSIAHVEKSMRDCLSDLFKVDFPEGGQVLDKHGKFKIPAGVYDQFYEEFLGVLGFDEEFKFTRANRKLELELLGIRILDGEYKEVPLNDSYKNLHIPSKRYPDPLPDDYSVYVEFVPRHQKSVEYHFTFRRSDGIGYYKKLYSFAD